MSDSVWPHWWQPTRLLCPWDPPGKNTGVGCHFLLQCIKVKSESEVAQSCPTLSDPMDCSLPGSSIHGIFQARVLEWGAIAFSENPNIGGWYFFFSKTCMETVFTDFSCLFNIFWTFRTLHLFIYFKILVYFLFLFFCFFLFFYFTILYWFYIFLSYNFYMNHRKSKRKQPQQS